MSSSDHRPSAGRLGQGIVDLVAASRRAPVYTVFAAFWLGTPEDRLVHGHKPLSNS